MQGSRSTGTGSRWGAKGRVSLDERLIQWLLPYPRAIPYGQHISRTEGLAEIDRPDGSSLLTESFPPAEMYGLTAQMRRAAVSIASNIAEGWGRRSRREYSKFVLIARGSNDELQTQLVIAGVWALASLPFCTASSNCRMRPAECSTVSTRSYRDQKVQARNHEALTSPLATPLEPRPLNLEPSLRLSPSSPAALPTCPSPPASPGMPPTSGPPPQSTSTSRSAHPPSAQS